MEARGPINITIEDKDSRNVEVKINEVLEMQRVPL